MLPDTPAIGDTVKGYAVTSWLGVAGPAGLPAPFVSRINAELKAILAEPAVIARLRELGSDTRPTTPEGFKELVADDVAKWTRSWPTPKSRRCERFGRRGTPAASGPP